MLFTESEIERCLVTRGDLLVCEGGDVGRAAIWCYDYDICIQNHIHRLRSILPLCNQFYYYIFYLYKLTNRIGGKGTAIQGLSSDSIDKLLIPLPPLIEQKRIVAEIEKWFALIDDIEAQKSDLQDYIKQTKSKVLDLAIHGKLVPQDPNDEPASVLLERIRADDLQAVAALHGLFVDGALVGHPHDEGVGVLELVEIVVGLGVMRHKNVSLPFQKGHTLRADGLGHGNFHT